MRVYTPPMTKTRMRTIQLLAIQGGYVRNFQLCVVTLVVFITACTTNLNTQNWAKTLIENEYRIKQKSVVVNINCTLFDKLSPTYGIQTETNYDKNGIWTRAGCDPKVISNVDVGTKIIITDISMRTDASGRCWNVQAKLPNGLDVFVPSCKFFHTNLWVTPQQPVDNDLEFKFNKAYLAKE
ncbi:MAG: hypothetical protein WBO26_18305 [Providencia rettgeri]